jgi:hypothetical protein
MGRSMTMPTIARLVSCLLLAILLVLAAVVGSALMVVLSPLWGIALLGGGAGARLLYEHHRRAT